jgi:hypothetical protein
LLRPATKPDMDKTEGSKRLFPPALSWARDLMSLRSSSKRMLRRNQSPSTAATHRASKGGDNISASLILLALRQYRYETQRNNARLWFFAANFWRIFEISALGVDDEESQNHQHNVRDEDAGYGWPYSTLSSSAKTPSLPSGLSSGLATSATTLSSSILS